MNCAYEAHFAIEPFINYPYLTKFVIILMLYTPFRANSFAFPPFMVVF